MAEILVRAVEGANPDPSANPHRGDPVSVHLDGHAWGLAEGPPEYVIVKVPGVSKATLEQYATPGFAKELGSSPPRRTKKSLANASIGILSPFGDSETTAVFTKKIVRRRRHSISESIVSLAEANDGEVTVSANDLAIGILDNIGE
jgi:hypothetical protein